MLLPVNSLHQLHLRVNQGPHRPNQRHLHLALDLAVQVDLEVD